MVLNRIFDCRATFKLQQGFCDTKARVVVTDLISSDVYSLCDTLRLPKPSARTDDTCLPLWPQDFSRCKRRDDPPSAVRSTWRDGCGDGVMGRRCGCHGLAIIPVMMRRRRAIGALDWLNFDLRKLHVCFGRLTFGWIHNIGGPSLSRSGFARFQAIWHKLNTVFLIACVIIYVIISCFAVSYRTYRNNSSFIISKPYTLSNTFIVFVQSYCDGFVISHLRNHSVRKRWTRSDFENRAQIGHELER